MIDAFPILCRPIFRTFWKHARHRQAGLRKTQIREAVSAAARGVTGYSPEAVGFQVAAIELAPKIN